MSEQTITPAARRRADAAELVRRADAEAAEMMRQADALDEADQQKEERLAAVNREHAAVLAAIVNGTPLPATWARTAAAPDPVRVVVKPEAPAPVKVAVKPEAPARAGGAGPARLKHLARYSPKRKQLRDRVMRLLLDLMPVTNRDGQRDLLYTPDTLADRLYAAGYVHWSDRENLVDHLTEILAAEYGAKNVERQRNSRRYFYWIFGVSPAALFPVKVIKPPHWSYARLIPLLVLPRTYDELLALQPELATEAASRRLLRTLLCKLVKERRVYESDEDDQRYTLMAYHVAGLRAEDEAAMPEEHMYQLVRTYAGSATNIARHGALMDPPIERADMRRRLDTMFAVGRLVMTGSKQLVIAETKKREAVAAVEPTPGPATETTLQE